MATEWTCPTCHQTVPSPEDGVDETSVCAHCGSLLGASAVEINPYAPPSAPMEPKLELVDGLYVVPATVLGKYIEAFRLLLTNLGLFGALVLTVWLPGNTLIMYLLYYGEPSLDSSRDWFLKNFIEGLFAPLYVGGLIYALDKRVRGERCTYRASIAVGLRSWGRMFGTRFFTELLIVVGLALLVVPGVLRMIKYALIDTVVVLEGTSGSPARERSVELTAGRRLRVFEAGFAFGILIFAASFGAAWIQDELLPINTMWTSLVVNCLLDVLYSIIIIVMFLFYWEAVQAQRPEDGEVRRLQEAL